MTNRTSYKQKYTKNLSKSTGLRLDENLRIEAEEVAFECGMTFSQFVRQSLKRNIAFCKSKQSDLITNNFGN